MKNPFIPIIAALIVFILHQAPVFAQESTAQNEESEELTPVEEMSTVEMTPNTPEFVSTRSQNQLYEDYKRFETPNFNKAMKYFFEKKLEMAEYLLQQELQTNPENYLACSYLGDIFLYKGKYDEAITLYKRALDLQGESAETYFQLGRAYYYKELGNLAIEHYSKAYILNPQLKFSQYHIGLTYLMILRNKEKTIEHWETYLQLAPEDPQYEKISRAIDLLKDPNFKIPPVGSDIPLEEALHLGGSVLQKTERKDTNDQSAGHETIKTINEDLDIERDDDL